MYRHVYTALSLYIYIYMSIYICISRSISLDTLVGSLGPCQVGAGGFPPLLLSSCLTGKDRVNRVQAPWTGTSQSLVCILAGHWWL